MLVQGKMSTNRRLAGSAVLAAGAGALALSSGSTGFTTARPVRDAVKEARAWARPDGASQALLASPEFRRTTNPGAVAVTSSAALVAAVTTIASRSSRARKGLLPAGPVRLAASENELAPREKYAVGISWYLMHFVVGITNDGLMKYLGASLQPFQIVFLRFVAAAATLLPVMLFQGKQAFRTSRVWMHGLRGALLAAGIALWCLGLTMMDFASCVVVNNTMPFFKMTFAKIFLGEKVGKERWLASLGGFIGCLIVFNPTAATFNPLSLVLLLSAVCFAMLDILNKKYAVSESTASMLFYGSIATAALSAPVARAQWVAVAPKQWALFGLLGVGANGLLYCLLKAFRYVDASATCPYRYTEFVLSAVAGFLIFGEKPTLATLLGSCIILPSVVYCALKEMEVGNDDKAESAAPAEESAAPAEA